MATVMGGTAQAQGVLTKRKQNAVTGTSAGSSAGGTGAAASSGVVSGGNNPYVSGKDDYGDTDYSVLLGNAMKAGASADEVQSLLDKRTDKAVSNGYTQYAYDDVYSSARDYINQNQAVQQPVVQQQSGVNDYSSYLEELNRAQQEAALAELRASYESNLAGLNRTEQTISPTYQAARNQAAGGAEQAKRQFAEFAAANGLNSGAGGQAQLAMNNQLQANLSNLNTQEAASLADLELQRSQTEIDYNNAIAQAQASGNATLAAQLYQEKVRVDEALRQQMESAAQREFQQAQFQWQQDQANIANQQDSTAVLYQMVMQYAQETGDFALLGQFGFTADQIAAREAAWRAERLGSLGTSASGVVSSGGNSNGNSGNGNGPTLTAGQGVSADSGLLTLQGELATLEDRFAQSPDTVLYQARNLIQSYYDRGSITEETARRLLGQYGVG